MNLGADAFVLIISEDSIRSEACRDELTLAVQNKKLILPVSHRDHGDDNRLDSALRTPQWTMLREEDDFERGVDDLVRAVHTDFELLETHAELLLAAERWRDASHNAGHLLPKDLLREAEAWLARVSTQPEKLPQPTAVQTDLIFASQRAQTRTTRRLLLIAGGIIAVMAVLVVIAFNQRNLARRQQAAAEEQTRIATANFAGQIGTVSLTFADHACDTALLLAVEATRIADTKVSRGALLAALVKHPHLVTMFHGHSRIVQHVVFSGDGRSIASTDERNVVVGDLASGATRRNERIGDLQLKSVALSHDGSLVAAGDNRGRVWIWNARTLEPAGAPLGTEGWGKIDQIAFTRDTSKLISVEGATVTVWDLKTRRSVAQAATDVTVTTLAVSADGTMIALGGEGAVVLALATLRRIGRTLEPQDEYHDEQGRQWFRNGVEHVYFTADDTRLATVTSQANFIEWDLRTGRRITPRPQTWSSVPTERCWRRAVREAFACGMSAAAL